MKAKKAKNAECGMPNASKNQECISGSTASIYGCIKNKNKKNLSYPGFNSGCFHIYIAPGYIYIAPGYIYIAPGYICIAPGYICIAPGYIYIAPGYIFFLKKIKTNASII